MLEQDYLAWSRQMTGLLQGERAEWAKPWLELCKACDPLAPADENRLAAIAQAYTDYLLRCKSEGLHFIQPGRFVLPGDMAGAGRQTHQHRHVARSLQLLLPVDRQKLLQRTLRSFRSANRAG